MNYNSKKLNEIFGSNLFIILIFGILSIFSGVYLIKSQVFGFTWDIHFHWQRIQEIKESFGTQSFFSDVALNQFHQSGSAVMALYPKINIIPMAIISLFFKSFFNVMYVSFILRNFIGLIISYFACYNFVHNKKLGFLFSVTYTISTTVLALSFYVTDIGMTSSLLYLPMVLFGTFELLNNYKWKEISIGLIAISMCHVITSIMSILMVCFFLIINLNKLKDNKVIYSLFKSFGSFILVSSTFWLPFSQLMLHNKIIMPSTTPSLVGTDISNWMFATFNNTPNINLTIFCIIGLLLSIIGYSRLSGYSKQIFFLSIIMLFIGTPFFPWNFLTHTFLISTFQFTWRIYIIPQLLLSYLFAEEVTVLCSRSREGKRWFLSIIFIVILSQFVGQKNIIDNGRNRPINSNSLTTLYADYFPKRSLRDFKQIDNKKVIYDKKETTARLLGNGRMDFELDENTKSLIIPFMIYNDIQYDVKVDGKKSNFYSSSYGEMMLKNLSKGKHLIEIVVIRSWYDYLSYILSTLGVFSLLYSYIIKLYYKLKNKNH
ncbi:MAG: hypothetical protein M3Z82_06885 [Apilactobacillus sp.]|nr:hypothetical protein [Apilactobacillus sp.]